MNWLMRAVAATFAQWLPPSCDSAPCKLEFTRLYETGAILLTSKDLNPMVSLPTPGFKCRRNPSVPSWTIYTAFVFKTPPAWALVTPASHMASTGSFLIGSHSRGLTGACFSCILILKRVVAQTAAFLLKGLGFSPMSNTLDIYSYTKLFSGGSTWLPQEENTLSTLSSCHFLGDPNARSRRRSCNGDLAAELGV